MMGAIGRALVAASIGAGLATIRIMFSVDPPACVIGVGWNTPLCHVFIISDELLQLSILGMVLGMGMWVIDHSEIAEELTQS